MTHWCEVVLHLVGSCVFLDRRLHKVRGLSCGRIRIAVRVEIGLCPALRRRSGSPPQRRRRVRRVEGVRGLPASDLPFASKSHQDTFIPVLPWYRMCAPPRPFHICPFPCLVRVAVDRVYPRGDSYNLYHSITVVASGALYFIYLGSTEEERNAVS